MSDRGAKMTTAASPNTTTLPRAVRAQVQRVNERLEARKTAAVAATPPDVANAPATDVTDSEPLQQPAAQTAPPATPAVDPRENDPAYWRQRFNVTQGMLRTQQDQHREQLAAKEREITELREHVRALEAGTQKAPTDVSTFFTQEQIEQFGEEQCQAMAEAAIKAAQQQAQALIEAEVKPIKEKAQADAQTAQQRREAEFWERLTELFPAWEEVNASESWLAWLTEPDEATGLVRQEILTRHHQAFNAVGVAKVFQAFEKSQQRPTPPVAPPRATAAGTSTAAQAPAPGKGYPSEAEIKDYYKRKSTIRNPRDPRYVTEQEQAEFEARLKLKATA
jgi:hypothetical protein